MIKYLALMKFGDATPAETLKQIEGQLKVLGRTIAEVAAWSVGRSLSPDGSSAPWTFVVVADFKDEQAYQKYVNHPQHQAFRDFVSEAAGQYREQPAGMYYQASFPNLWWVVHEGGVPIPVPPPEFRLPPLA